MSRTLPSGYAALATGKVFKPVFLVFLDWPGGAVYLWGGYGTISWNGHTWTGTGTHGTISSVGESTDLKANGVSLSLAGIPSDLVINALANNTQGAVAEIFLGCLSEAGALTVDPLKIFKGMIDICPMEDSGSTCTISVQLEKELIDRRLNLRRYTHEDQQIEYAGDLFFEYVVSLPDKEITWGKAGIPAGLTAGAYYPTAVGMVRFE